MTTLEQTMFEFYLWMVGLTFWIFLVFGMFHPAHRKLIEDDFNVWFFTGVVLSLLWPFLSVYGILKRFRQFVYWIVN